MWSAIAATVFVRIQGAQAFAGRRRRPDQPLQCPRFLGPGVHPSRPGDHPGPDDFYILASREPVARAGRPGGRDAGLRYAGGRITGCITPVFRPRLWLGGDQRAGSRAVLEVRSHEVPFQIDHGQIIGRLVYERLIARPTGSMAARSARPISARASRSPSTSRSRRADALHSLHPSGHSCRRRSRWRRSQ